MATKDSGNEEILVIDDNLTKEENGAWKVKLDILEKGVHDLKKQIDRFQAQKDSKDYQHMEEMLTRHLLLLDNIDSNGNEEIRKQRRAVNEAINTCIISLESRVEESDGCYQNSALSSCKTQVNPLFTIIIVTLLSCQLLNST